MNLSILINKYIFLSLSYSLSLSLSYTHTHTHTHTHTDKSKVRACALIPPFSLPWAIEEDPVMLFCSVYIFLLPD